MTGIYRITHTACLALAGFFILSFLVVALSSITYPFQLEWMEGHVIDTVARAASGQAIYAKPSLEFVAFMYTPLYYYVAAFVSLFTGVDFFAARLVSLLSILGVGALLYAWLRKENAGKPVALLTVGLFFGTYPLSGRWFDIARVDSLFLLLTLSSVFVLYFYRSRQSALLVAVLMTAAFFTKQSSLFITLPALAAMFFINRRRTLLTGACMAMLLIISVLIYNAATDGWFDFYVFEIGAKHPLRPSFMVSFWNEDMLPHLAILFAIGVFFLIQLAGDRKKFLWYATLALSFVGCSYLSRMHWGGFVNVLMPAHLILALLAGLLLAQEQEKPLAPLVSTLVLFQMVMMLYNPLTLVPSQASRQQGEAFLAKLSQINGEVLLPEWQFVQTRAGKKSYALGMAAYDVLHWNWQERNTIKDDLVREIAQAIIDRKFAAVMPGGLIPVPGLKNFYHVQERLNFPKEYVTGSTRFLRTDLYVPNDPTPSQP